MMFFSMALIYLGGFAAAVYLTMHGHWQIALACLVLVGTVSASSKQK